MTVFFGTPWSSVKEINAPYMPDWEHSIVLHLIKGDLASSHFDLGYTEIFHIPVVTSVSF